MNNLYFVQLFKKNVLTCYIFVSHNVNIVFELSALYSDNKRIWKSIHIFVQFLNLKYMYNEFEYTQDYIYIYFGFLLYICVSVINFCCIYVLGVSISIVYMCQWYIFLLYIPVCVRGIDFYCIYVSVVYKMVYKILLMIYFLIYRNLLEFIIFVQSYFHYL